MLSWQHAAQSALRGVLSSATRRVGGGALTIFQRRRWESDREITAFPSPRGLQRKGRGIFSFHLGTDPPKRNRTPCGLSAHPRAYALARPVHVHVPVNADRKMSWSLEPADAGRSRTVNIDRNEFDLGRRHLGPEFVFVSRVQAKIRVPPEVPLPPHSVLQATSWIESLNEKNATGVRRAHQTDWLWLTCGQTLTLSPGDSIALDRKLKPGTVFTLCKTAVNPAGASSQQLPCTAATKGKWYWGAQGGKTWNAFDADAQSTIEAAFAAGEPRASIGSHSIDFASMRQVRNDDPTRTRPVKREAEGAADGVPGRKHPAAAAAIAPPAPPPTQAPPPKAPHKRSATDANQSEQLQQSKRARPAMAASAPQPPQPPQPPPIMPPFGGGRPAPIERHSTGRCAAASTTAVGVPRDARRRMAGFKSVRWVAGDV